MLPTPPDANWITVRTTPGDQSGDTSVAIDRQALKAVMRDDPRPPEVILHLICERALKRMPMANGPEGLRLITPHNLGLVWPK